MKAKKKKTDNLNANTKVNRIHTVLRRDFTHTHTHTSPRSIVDRATLAQILSVRCQSFVLYCIFFVFEELNVKGLFSLLSLVRCDFLFFFFTFRFRATRSIPSRLHSNGCMLFPCLILCLHHPFFSLLKLPLTHTHTCTHTPSSHVCIHLFNTFIVSGCEESQQNNRGQRS